MKQALESLKDLNEQSKPPIGIPLPAEIDTAMDALAIAIEQMEKAEPVAWMDSELALCDCDQRLPDDIPLYAHPASTVPEGWKLVPIEPTREMLRASYSVGVPKCTADQYIMMQYKAMLAAAPEYKK
jgi:hypothetical protein